MRSRVTVFGAVVETVACTIANEPLDRRTYRKTRKMRSKTDTLA